MEPLPEFRALLSRLRRVQPEADRSIDRLRIGMNGALKRWAGPGPAVAAVRDSVVDGPYRSIPVRHYEPFATEGPLPAVVFCHGSGFVMGDLDTHDSLARRLALASAAVVVSVDYLLAPEHPFPAAVHEALAVVEWIAEGGAGPRVDRHRIALAGDSAGGAITAGTAMLARDRGGPRPDAQLLVYPVCATTADTESWKRYGEGYFLDAADMEWFWSQYLARPEQANDPYAVPLAGHDLRGLPSAVLVTAGCDPLQDEGREWAARLREAGGDVCAFSYDGAIHGFMTMFELSSSAATAVRLAGAALRDVAGWRQQD
jgi:acetyl esterase